MTTDSIQLTSEEIGQLISNPKNFTEKAWEVIVKSSELARRFRHHTLEVEHLLMAMLEQEEGFVGYVFLSMDLSVTRLQKQVEKFLLRKRAINSSNQIYLGVRLEKWIKYAEKSRKSFGYDFIGIENLLLGLIDCRRKSSDIHFWLLNILKGSSIYDLIISLDLEELEKMSDKFEETVKSLCKTVTDCSAESEYASLRLYGRIQNLQQQIPIVSDKALIDLVNGIQINQDIISFRQTRSFIGRLFDGITGKDRERQILVESNLNSGILSLHQLILALSDNLRISDVALEITQAKLLEVRNAIRKHRQEIDLLNQLNAHLQIQLDDHEQRIQHLEKRVYRIEVIQKIDVIIAAWLSGRTYQGFYWIVQLVFVTREIVDFALSDYESMTGDISLRSKIIDQLIIASGQKILDKSISLTELLNLAYQETETDKCLLAQTLLEVRSLSPLRLSSMPYLFTIGTTFELATLTEEYRPTDPAKIAFELCCRDYSLIHPVIGKKELIERIVHETSSDRLVLRNSVGK
jgi:hypothetical protein